MKGRTKYRLPDQHARKKIVKEAMAQKASKFIDQICNNKQEMAATIHLNECYDRNQQKREGLKSSDSKFTKVKHFSVAAHILDEFQHDELKNEVANY